MKRQMLYLIGQPGAGKSSLMNALVEDLMLTRVPITSHSQTKHTQLWSDDYLVAVELGVQRGSFGGTDSLPMDAQPYVLEWLSACRYSIILAEGDRLANEKFFTAVWSMGIDLSVVYLDTFDGIAAMRRKLRGSFQNLSWVKGRASKVRHLAQVWVDPKWHLPGSLPLSNLSKRLQRHPVIQSMTESHDG